MGLAVWTAGAAFAAGPAPGPLPEYRLAEGARTVQGKPSSADAPPLEPDTVYEDTVSPGERFYRLALDDTSDFYVSAVVRPGKGSKVGYSDGIEVEIMTKEGRRCPNPGRADFGYDPVPTGAAAVRRVREDAECQAGGIYYAKVTRTAAKDSAGGAWPVELLVRREPGLGGPVPTVAPSVWPSASPTLPGTEPVGRTGGTGFNDARALGSGVWRDDLRPGQTRFYRVPLDWGQQLGVGAEIAAAEMTKPYGSAAGGLTVSLYSPFRGLVGSEDTSYDGKQAAVTLPKTAPVAYENRYANEAGVRGAGVAGWYYLAVTLGGKVAEFTRDATPVPLTLRMEVIGAPAKAPAYRESLGAAGFGVGPADRTAAKEGLTGPEAAAAESDRSVMRVVAGAGFGTGAVLLLGLGAWFLLARRNAGPGH
ncbi:MULTISPECIES: hypothetical protein [unclassified Streptomyces]|uniref:hypothetical protein n=1 Tax=unclassified Streptomyces TaxID=2593676 RepID=UPI002E37DFE5|nr:MULTISPECIES: hypothetical protein [unclassified Streptomyces]WUC65620.1 hypothetical protein OG861_16015 [Streptomyces sp. NBC_00539]